MNSNHLVANVVRICAKPPAWIDESKHSLLSACGDLLVQSTHSCFQEMRKGRRRIRVLVISASVNIFRGIARDVSGDCNGVDGQVPSEGSIERNVLQKKGEIFLQDVCMTYGRMTRCVVLGVVGRTC